MESERKGQDTGPPRGRDRSGGAHSDRPLYPSVAAIELGSIELAVVAELNLEIASAYDEVAADATQQPETRRRAREGAIRRRLRAGLLHLESERLLAQPSLPEERSTRETELPYVGQERRKYERRAGERRAQYAARDSSGGGDRRGDRDRRRDERRRQSLRSA